jgi:hypothetical protein
MLSSAKIGSNASAHSSSLRRFQMNFGNILAYIIWDVNPDIFVIPGIDHPVRWYRLSWALGFLVSQQVMYCITYYRIEKGEGLAKKSI